MPVSQPKTQLPPVFKFGILVTSNPGWGTRVK
jgi:hypothetical protein